MDVMLRLDKYLADMGCGTRSQVRELLKRKRVLVNGRILTDGGYKVKPEDSVVADGKPVQYVEFEYFMLNKPQGVVSATEDNLYPTVLSLLDGQKRKDLFPVGRLDIDTEGLLLITNDGALAHRLLSPAHHVDKTYYVETETDIPQEAVLRMAEGILLHEDGITLPAKLELVGKRSAKLTIQEGKFHQVKRMFAAIGCRVTFLKRLTMGPLRLDEALKPGQFRPLTTNERKALEDV